MYYNAEDMLQEIFRHMNLLIGERDFERTICILTELGRVLVNADRTSFWYWDREKKQYWTLASFGTDRITVPEGSGIVGVSISGKETLIIDSAYEDPRFNVQVDKTTGYITKTILCMPVTDEQGEVIGAYQALNKLDANGMDVKFDQNDVNRLALAAVYCGKMLETHLLQTVSRIDQLTGLKNRHYFKKAYETCLDTDRGSGIIICDIDFFKKVNDTYGHNGGDAVLINVANLIRNCVGPKGEVIRWGGEEFLVLLKDCDIVSLKELAELIRVRVEQSICPYDDQVIKVTMSFGITMIQRELTADENIKCADEKLYLAKAGGRNQVVK